MEDEGKTAVSAPPAVVTVPPESDAAQQEGKSKLWIVIVAAVLIIGLLITGLVLLIRSDTETTSHWRDIFIIVMALESLIIGAALVILIVQIATLINLLQHEIKPILNSTNETVNTLKGTTKFLSENLTGPVIELNATLAAVKAFFDVLRPGKSRRR
ncbi:MAG TPA: hypothetical protein VIO36_01735 [Anaerolineaceae bacterium]